jgi:hypothetical protein
MTRSMWFAIRVITGVVIGLVWRSAATKSLLDRALIAVSVTVAVVLALSVDRKASGFGSEADESPSC